MMDADEEFFDDFGAAAIPDSELRMLLNRARENGDRELRLLVKQFQTLRYVSALLLERLEAAYSPEELAADQVIKLGRFIVRGEGGIGT
jgi:hypothetical protein